MEPHLMDASEQLLLRGDGGQHADQARFRRLGAAGCPIQQFDRVDDRHARSPFELS